MLVVITVVLSSVIGIFMMGVVHLPSPSPRLYVVCSHSSNRWGIHITSVSERVPISEFRLIAAHADGTYVRYDSDADLVQDRWLVSDLDTLTVLAADWPRLSPLVFVDQDSDSMIGPGDFLVAFGLFFSPAAPLLDATRGYQEVEPAPGGIPRGSQLLIVASSDTIPGCTVNPGDTVRVILDKGGPFEVIREGIASPSGLYVALVDVEQSWVPATYMQTTFTVRPGDVDEWTGIIPFKVNMDDPLTPSERERYDQLTRPLGPGDTIILVHKTSDSVVLSHRL